MRHNINLTRLVAAGGGAILPFVCAANAQQSIISGHVAVAKNQTTQLNIEYESGTLEDPAYQIMMQKRQQAAEEALAELGVEIPQEIIEITDIVGTEYGICPELLQAIIWQESRCIASVKNASCSGLMQINVANKFNKDHIKEMAADKNLTYAEAIFNAEINIEAGAQLLKYLFDNFGDDPAEILMRYNGDSTNLKRYKSGGDMSQYAADTLEISELLERAHGK